jgi:hypothetical protein
MKGQFPKTKKQVLTRTIRATEPVCFVFGFVPFAGVSCLFADF